MESAQIALFVFFNSVVKKQVSIYIYSIVMFYYVRYLDAQVFVKLFEGISYFFAVKLTNVIFSP